MHEFSLINALMETVMESAEANNITNVTKVKLIIGEYHGALPEALTFAFQALSTDTVCRNAELDIEIKKGRLQCTACGHQFSNPVAQNKCSECGSFKLDITTGRELYIDYYEGE